MSNCLCLACDRLNSITTKFCSQCGAKLQIQERYRALKVIGQGSFGKTFLAQDDGLPSKPKCAIKQFLYDDPETLQDAKRLFEQEAIHLDDLGKKHEQIPKLLAHAEQDGIQYLVQEFIDGEDLKKELKKLGAFSETKIEELLLDLLPVLQFIHASEVIHRDIKPENIIRRQVDQKFVLVDFGAAKVASHAALEGTGTTIGSAGYASPEQAFGKVFLSSDIYSLGVTCLNLLTNVHPLDMYDSYDPMASLAWQKFLQGREISKKLCKILDKMTQPSVIHRYKSVDDVLKDLQKHASSQSQSVANAMKVIQKPASSRPHPLANVAKVIQPQQISARPPINEVKSTPKQPQAIVKVFVPKSTTRSISISIPSAPSQSTKSSFSSFLTIDCGKGSILEMVKVEAGSFSMGSDENAITQPIHRVQMCEFFIGKYAVTQAQYQAVMDENPSKFNNNQNPVEKVSWNDAINFCQKLSQKTGHKVQLPCEAAWEYAAKGGNKGKGYEYAGSNNLDEVGWYRNNADRKTHPVGQKKANEIGIYDMSGGVWEWCLDEWHDSYHGKPFSLKNNGHKPWSAMSTTKNGNCSHVLRGGSWRNGASTCRSAIRIRDVTVNRHLSLGFRVVQILP